MLFVKNVLMMDTQKVSVVPDAQGILPPVTEEYPENCYNDPLFGWLGEFTNENDWPGIELDAVDSDLMSSGSRQFLGRRIGDLSDFRYYDGNIKKLDYLEDELTEIRQVLLDLGFDDDEIGFYLLHQIR